MPSFSKETIESWREERVSNSSIPKDLDNWQISNALNVCEEDLEEEERRLELALLNVKESRTNIKSLKNKKEKLMKLKEEAK